MARVSLAIAFLLLFLTPASAGAQGSGTPTPEIQLGRQLGLVYDITVFSTPPEPVEGLGGPRFSVRALRKVGGDPIIDATVVIALDRPDGSPAGQVALNPNPRAPGIYEARLTLPDKGIWEWTVVVAGPEATDSVSGDIKVVAGPSAGRAGTVAWLIMLAIISALALAVYFNLRPKN